LQEKVLKELFFCRKYLAISQQQSIFAEKDELSRTCSIGKLIRFYLIPRQAFAANGGPHP
jgi:hypothetical protein